ncbi:hypothetical protein IVB12_15235 [Bradyrhizobium sp. 179]|uniref:Pam3-gp28 family putative phage holin n=1 Tax=Bradyrhizobium sp. 179 TaxID=2782648 RepID=UPI001FF9C897|nr:hypothetical protein [Bradyrhizobium sp. 179]MCK1543268.1 hypothetical protein [Bradyrhizobium sp. 179]
MTGEQVWGVVRTILAAVGGYFVTKGMVDGAFVDAVLGGAGTIFVAVWSIVSKKKTA